jgi:hypothetical protein
MPEHLLFLTGRLARSRVAGVLQAMQPTEFTYAVHDVGVKVAALMTADLIRRRLPKPVEADRIILPGRCRTDLDALGAHYGVTVMRGPDDINDLPEFFGRKGQPRDLSATTCACSRRSWTRRTSIDDILRRAGEYRTAGADVIDLGCLPDTPFPHLEDAVHALAAAGHHVSVDSADTDELRRAAKAGAQFLLSLTEETLSLLDDVDATPVLIPARHGDLASLLRAMDALDRRGRPYLADPSSIPSISGS